MCIRDSYYPRPYGPLWANMTPCTKPEVHNVLHCRLRRTEPWPQILTCTENFVKFVHVFLRYANGQTDRQTHRPTDVDRNTSHLSRGEVTRAILLPPLRRQLLQTHSALFAILFWTSTHKFKLFVNGAKVYITSDCLIIVLMYSAFCIISTNSPTNFQDNDIQHVQ